MGLDNMNHYYDVRLKEARLNELEQFENFSFVKGNLADKAVIESIFEQYKPEIVVNLGAQAGVRYSITNPDAYVEANLIGFYNILEACRHSYDEGHTPVEHLVYASSSSVYGSNKKVPYSTDDKVDNPVSLYLKGGEVDKQLRISRVGMIFQINFCFIFHHLSLSSLSNHLAYFIAQQQACIQIAVTIYTQACPRTSLFCFLLYQLSLWWVKYRAQPEAIST